MTKKLDIERKLNERDAAEIKRTNEEVEKDFFELHNKVRDSQMWDDVQTKNWFCRKNYLLANFTPLDYYGKQPAKCIKWINHLIENGVEL
jgi:hypothetical protein